MKQIDLAHGAHEVERTEPPSRDSRPTRARRSHQWCAVAGALVLLGWNSGESHESQAAPSFHAQATVESALSAANHLGREDIVRTLISRNSHLGRRRAIRIADAVLRCTNEQALPDLTPRLILSIMFQESDARPHAISPKGAVGLMQVMPYMYRVLSLPGGIAHLESNIEAGCLVLADNIRRLGREKGISSYFWGSHIRSNDYLNGVETILKTLSADSDSAQSPDQG